MARQQPPTWESRRTQVRSDLEAAIVQIQDEIAQLEALLAAKREVERLQAEWARAAAESEPAS